jgi:hypothetical protein
MQLRSAMTLTRQQQTGVLETIETPFWSAPLTDVSIDRTAFGSPQRSQDTELEGVSQRA